MKINSIILIIEALIIIFGYNKHYRPASAGLFLALCILKKPSRGRLFNFIDDFANLQCRLAYFYLSVSTNFPIRSSAWVICFVE